MLVVGQQGSVDARHGSVTVVRMMQSGVGPQVRRLKGGQEAVRNVSEDLGKEDEDVWQVNRDKSTYRQCPWWWYKYNNYAAQS